MDKMIVNGYNVPGGLGRIAICAGVDYLQKNGGSAPMKSTLQEMVRVSGLNHSTAGWLTTPSSARSPVNYIFTRFKARDPESGRNVFFLSVSSGAEHLGGLVNQLLADEKARREESLENHRIMRVNASNARLAQLDAKPGDMLYVKDFISRGPGMLIGVDHNGEIELRDAQGKHYVFEHQLKNLYKI